MLLWIMFNEHDGVGVQYDLEQDRWFPISKEGAPTPSAGAIWTGTEMLAWGHDRNGRLVAAGAYDPTQDRWRSLSTDGIGGKPVWAGNRVLTWGGGYANHCRVGGVYDVATDTWSTFTGQGAPSERYGHHLAWTGHSLLVYGGLGGYEGTFPQDLGGEFFPDP